MSELSTRVWRPGHVLSICTVSETLVKTVAELRAIRGSISIGSCGNEEDGGREVRVRLDVVVLDGIV